MQVTGSKLLMWERTGKLSFWSNTKTFQQRNIVAGKLEEIRTGLTEDEEMRSIQTRVADRRLGAEITLQTQNSRI